MNINFQNVIFQSILHEYLSIYHQNVRHDEMNLTSYKPLNSDHW